MKPLWYATFLQIVVLFASHVLAQTVTPAPTSADIDVTVSGLLVSGKDVTIQCNVQRMSPGMWIEWEYNFLPIDFLSDAYKEGRVENTTGGSASTLIIKNSIRCDSGLYSCCVGEECQDKEVEIGEPPRIVSPPTAPAALQQGNEVLLQCAATGKPDLQITWSKDSKQISANNQYTITFDNTTDYISGRRPVDLISNLTIKSFSAADNGNYLCNASNKWGSNASTPVNLTVEGVSAPFNCKYPPSNLPTGCSGIALPGKPSAVLDVSPSILPGDQYKYHQYAVSVYWNGWTCFGLSQCRSKLDFTCKLYPLKQDGKNHSVAKSHHAVGVVKDEHPIDTPVKFHLPPGISMIELTVKVKGTDESSVARSLVLVDNDSKVGASSLFPLNFSSANNNKFQTDLSSGVLTLNWKDHFFNSYIKQNPWILYPVQVQPPGLNVAKSPLSFEGVKTAGDSGIIQYNISLSRIHPSTAKLQSVSLDKLNETYSFSPLSLKNKEVYRANVLVTDIFGHQGSDFVDVYMDSTPPQITKTEIWKRSQPSIKDGHVCKSVGGTLKTDHYSLEFSVSDDESGISHVYWRVESGGPSDSAHGTVPYAKIDKAICTRSQSCSCSLDDFCYNPNQAVDLTSISSQSSYNVTLKATSRSSLNIPKQLVVSVKNENSDDTFVNSITTNSPSSTSIHAQWSHLSAASSYVLTVCVKYNSGECGPCVDTSTTGTSNSVTVTGLLPFTRYAVQVQANMGSTSILSVSKVERTQEGAPTAGPSNIKAIAVNSTVINVSWSHPPAKNRHGIITGYVMNVNRDGLLEKRLTLINNATTKTISKLRPNTLYSVQIAARTGGGLGNYSLPKTVVTKEAAPGGPPRNVNFTIVTKTSFKITWDRPEAALQYGVIIGYDLVYRAQTSEKVKTIKMIKTLGTTVQNLEPYTLYDISVSASTKAGQGVKFETTHRTAEAAPGPPIIDKNRLNALGTTSFTISWQPPTHPHGVVTEYIIVTYEFDTTPPDSNSPCDHPLISCTSDTSNHYVVTRLKPDTTYVVYMMAKTTPGRGNKSKTYEVKTKPEEIGAPQNLTTRENSSRAIHVEWEPPIVQSTELEYEIVYNRVDDNNKNKERQRTTKKTWILLENLQPYSYYQINVSVVSGRNKNTSTTFAYTKEDIPGKITVFYMNNVEASSINLYWEPPKDENGRIGYGYDIQDTVSQQPAKTVRIQQTDLQKIRNGFQYEVSSLNGDTTYRVSVFAYNIKLNKNGEQSHSVTIQTKTGIPGPPSSVSVTATNHTTILVLWQPPRRPNGELNQYEITRSRITRSRRAERATDQTNTIYYRVDATHRLFEIVNVGIGTEYEVTVRAINREGHSGEQSQPVRVKGQYRPPPPREPTDIMITNQSKSGFLVKWQAPNNTNGLRSYSIIVQEIGTKWIKNETVLPSLHSYLFDNLKSDTLYGVTVEAVYNDDEVRASQQRFNQTLEGVPKSAPRNFTIQVTGNSSVEMQWIAPPDEDINGLLCGFHVKYQTVTDNEVEMKNLNLEGRRRADKLESLESWQEYKVEIAAKTCGKEGGIGPYTEPVSVKTEEGVPELLSFDGVSDSPQNMALSWEIKPNGILTKAEIVINVTDSSPFPVKNSVGNYNWQNLSAYTVYTFELRANTSKGQSVKQLIRRTKTAIPEASPNVTQCQAQPGFDDSVIVSVTFDNIPEDHWNGVPQSYSAFLCQLNNDTKCANILAEEPLSADYYSTEQQKGQVSFELSKVNSSLERLVLGIRLAGKSSGGRGNYSQECLFIVEERRLPGPPSSSSGAAIAAGVVVPLVILIIAIVIIFVYWKRYRALKGKDLLPLEMANRGGMPGFFSTAAWLAEWPDYADLQFDRSKLEIIGDLGEGQFGIVHLAVATGIIPKEKKTKVAVKTLKGGSSRESAEDFKKELEIMMDFNHPKIIKLLGVCTKEEPLYLITELMTKGDLKDFVRKARPSESNPIGGLSLYELLDICSQVASGMAYLASIRFIHRDIAARNCLVGGSDTELIVKVADFGMAKDVYQSDYYKKKGGALPVRWMAPEAITDGRSTVHSDIWSFGVLMWEIFSFGYQPYFGINNDLVIGGVIQGTLRLQCAPGCPTVVFALMQQCWEKIPEDRIPAAELSQNLEDLVQMCKSSGADTVKQQAADRYQSLKRFNSTAVTQVSGNKGMVSKDVHDNNGYLTPVSASDGPANSMDGYTQLGTVIEEGENKYQQPQRCHGMNDDDAFNPREFDNPLYNTMIPLNQYDVPKQSSDPKSYVNVTDSQYDSPVQVETKQLGKKTSYMDMNASTLPQNQTQKEPYVDMTSTKLTGEYDNPLNSQSVYDKRADLQPKESYVDMGSGSTTAKYDDPMLWVSAANKAKQESHVGVSGSAAEKSMSKERYVDMDAMQVPHGKASVPQDKPSYVDMNAAVSVDSGQLTTSSQMGPTKVKVASKLSTDRSKSPETAC